MNGSAAKPDPWRMPALAAVILCLQAGVAMAHALGAGEPSARPAARWTIDIAPDAVRNLGGALDLARAAYEAGAEPMVEYGEFDWLAGEDEPPLPEL